MKWHDAGESKEVKYSSLQHEYHTPGLVYVIVALSSATWQWQ